MPNRAERRRLERADVVEKRKMLFGKVEYDAATLKRFIPDGEQPIASRYDPRTDKVHIAVASGTVYIVERTQLDPKGIDLYGEAIVIPEMIPETPPDFRDFMRDLMRVPPMPGYKFLEGRDGESEGQQLQQRLEESWARMQEQKTAEYMRQLIEAKRREIEQRDCRCAPPGEGLPDAEPCKLHPEGGGRDGQQGDGQPQPQPPRLPTLNEQWEFAEARYAEWQAFDHRFPTCECLANCRPGCGHNIYAGPISPYCEGTATVALKGDYHGNVRPVAGLCDTCARYVVAQRPDLLDWNPEE